MDAFPRDELESFRSIVAARLGLNFDESKMDLLAEVLHSPATPSKARTPIDVYNTNSWLRTDVIFLALTEYCG